MATTTHSLAQDYFIIFFSHGSALCCAFVSFVITGSLIARWRTKRELQHQVGLPTILWRPRFVNYWPNDDDREMYIKRYRPSNANRLLRTEDVSKMRSSSITNILPRMERLQGPFGMYATVYGVKTKVIHIAHPVPAKAVLQLAPVKQPGYDHFKNFCGNGVFTADGEEWKGKRCSVLHALLRMDRDDRRISTNSWRSRLEIESNKAADEVVRSILSEGSALLHARESPEDLDIVVKNIVPILQRATISIIYRYITHNDLPHECATIDSNSDMPNGKIAKGEEKDGRERVTLLQEYLRAVVRIRMIILAQARSIWFLLPRFFYTKFSPMFKMEEKTMQPIRELARKACLDAKQGSPLSDLCSRKSHQSVHQDGVTFPIVSKAMLDEAITLLFAGQDTTAATLSWTLHLLSLHPQVQERAAEEVKMAVAELEGDENGAKYISIRATTKMKFLDAVVKESMRLYPVAPFVVRRIHRDIRIPDSDVILPQNTLACIWIYGLHRNKSFWEQPDTFIPDRWFDVRDKGQKHGAYMPYASGPRNCLGQPIANVVLRLMLARLLQECIFVDMDLNREGSPDKLRKQMQAGFTVLPAGGVWVKVQRRV